MREIPIVVVHGGAGNREDARVRASRADRVSRALAAAAEAAQAVLRRDGPAFEAVVEAVVVLEEDPLFNAGHGAVPCADGRIELSASVMDGATGRVGAMVGLTRTRNPVRGAAALLDHAHCLLFGESADAFAVGAGLEPVPPDRFWTEARRRQWAERRLRTGASAAHERAPETVGAVALDRRGGLACATSTGGIFGQQPGRVGDTPVVGAGSWADDVCAVSATGDGDVFFRVAFARRVADLVELAALDIEAAARQALDEVARLGGLGGCIAIDRAGRIAAPRTAAQMPISWARGDETPSVRLGSEPTEPRLPG